MSKVCESWSLEDLTTMSEQDMEQLLGFYESGEVPALQTLRGDIDFEIYEFDGSFGWSI